MAEKIRKRTRYVELNANKASFVSRIIGSKEKHDFSDVKILRSLLSNEKSRILFALKSSKPNSIYQLAKMLKRDFKSVQSDVKMLERFGFLEFVSEKSGKRESYRPQLLVDQMQIQINI